jgi:hypothetical protein
VNIPLVSAGVVSSVGFSEPFRVMTYFLGAGCPTDAAATVVVTRTNNTVGMWAACTTFAAAGNTALNDIQTWSGNITGFAAKPVTDLSNGQNSIRFMTIGCGASTLPTTYTGCTTPQTIDYGVYTSTVIRQITPSQGSFDVGCFSLNNWVSAVALAVMDILPRLAVDTLASPVAFGAVGLGRRLGLAVDTLAVPTAFNPVGFTFDQPAVDLSPLSDVGFALPPDVIGYLAEVPQDGYEMKVFDGYEAVPDATGCAAAAEPVGCRVASA